MWSSRRFIVAAVCLIPYLAIVNTLIGSSISTPAERHFEFSCLAKIPALPRDAEILKIWIPLPQFDGYQSIEGLRMESPFAYARHRDRQYGNEYLYMEIPAAKIAEPAEIQVSFHAVGREHRAVEEDVEKFDASLLNISLNRHVIPTIIAFNFAYLRPASR